MPRRRDQLAEDLDAHFKQQPSSPYSYRRKLYDATLMNQAPKRHNAVAGCGECNQLCFMNIG